MSWPIGVAVVDEDRLVVAAIIQIHRGCIYHLALVIEPGLAAPVVRAGNRDGGAVLIEVDTPVVGIVSGLLQPDHLAIVVDLQVSFQFSAPGDRRHTAVTLPIEVKRVYH